MNRIYLELQDGTRIPLVWDGTRWDVVDYRKFDSVAAYKGAVDATGLHFAICCSWPLSQFMSKNNLTFPEAYELMTRGYEQAAKRRGLAHRNGNRVKTLNARKGERIELSEGKLIPVEYPHYHSSAKGSRKSKLK